MSTATAAGPPPPQYLSVDKAGKLVYTADDRGDRIPDFSHAGYGGGGVEIPDVPTRIVIAPDPGDATARIQAALDRIASLPADSLGFRGAVLLRAGRHEVAGSLRITTSGVVLRGEGAATVLVASGIGRRPLIRIEGRGERQYDSQGTSRVVDAYVPVGSIRLTLDRTSGFRVGDAVAIVRPATAEWIAALGMDRFPLGYEGSLNWRPGAMTGLSDRVVTAVDGAVMTLDAPLTDAIDAKLGTATIQRYTWDGRIERVGVEDLRCESAFDPSNPRDEEHAWDAVRIDAAQNVWVRNLAAAHFAGSTVRILDGSKQVTVQDCESVEPVSEIGGRRRDAFITSGQSTLFLRCRSSQGRHDFAVGALTPGPNAYVECTATEPLGFSGPVESWATGVLYDNVKIDGAGLSLTNRETEGQGAGWAGANSVLWQCSASVVTCRKPPGAHNWAIGCWGQFFGDGEWQAPNEFVKPESLYRAQLAERLGPSALKTLEPRKHSEHGIPSSTRDDSPTIASKPPAPVAPLTLQNGWLTRDDSVLTGGRIGTTWWRGSALPTRGGEFGVGVTRFVPGREGPGFTDDLDDLTDLMTRTGKSALEHHWGLWYDRRRDDHQMARRIDGDVWAPFLEQPWARSGRGTAWDGLSKYDLERFNPWYFNRLDEFAGHCDRKGLVLIHQAYFQHNILEAGAHWADFPWRPANCLQDTGFPEPPPYAGGKRIFMADHFYDVDHAVRRALHRSYIRHCLDVLGRHPNVVFLTGDEFTGPLHFMQFWFDVVAEWQRETGRKVLIGLSATKDVQDAILADPVRGPLVSVIELKYWWYLADGSLYAPRGGENLAPRQQQREWKGTKKRSVEATARAVREYRDRFPTKAVIVADAPDDGWATLAAGGSLAPLPIGVDPRLLRAVPRMQPIGRSESDDRKWILGDPGRNYLVYAGASDPVVVDLSHERAGFSARRVDPKTGRVDSSTETVRGGGPVKFLAADAGPTLLWLTTDGAADGETPGP
ncbi:DUF6298 domain-containing protein [Paludisphaera rhizosphaerae]|uniref:DUF6298 domain-containing protein n=1 Tax=Paludisphaera rhizosphaerae TaxID=2711216 RepID=UPI0013EB57EF|nr:DUF6298 domain-containing protein [Paludisphaera rhizosphaerae]